MGYHETGDREAITHRFAESDDVRLNTVTLIAPELVAGAAEARLHFIRDKETSRLAHDFCDRTKQVGGVTVDTIRRENGISDEDCEPVTVALQILDLQGNLVRHPLTHTFQGNAVGIRCRYLPYPGAQRRVTAECGGKTSGQVRVSVIGLRSDDYTFLAGVMHRHA
ncbi:hypothetical protein FQZ97_751600 [compost metagenome]